MKSSVVLTVLQILCEKGQNREDGNRGGAARLHQPVRLVTLDCWTNDMLFWEEGFVFVLTEKKKRKKEKKALDSLQSNEDQM